MFSETEALDAQRDRRAATVAVVLFDPLPLSPHALIAVTRQ